MEASQARGYILEYVVLQLLKDAGYVKVRQGDVRGRGAEHQIDAYGVLSIPTAFIYPIRLLSEAKFYTDSIELEIIRNFVGVLKDISENYIVSPKHQRSSFRYTDAGCLFSATPFVESAQEYAWAHNIFLVSFYRIDMMEDILDIIIRSIYTKDIAAILIDNQDKKSKIKRIITAYKKFEKQSILKKPTLVVGILDNVYPVILIGNKGWIYRVEPPADHDNLEIIKEYRQDIPQHNIENSDNRNQKHSDHIFHLNIKEQPVVFSLPHFASERILKRINRKKKVIANLQIPIVTKKKRKTVRRIISLDVEIPR